MTIRFLPVAAFLFSTITASAQFFTDTFEAYTNNAWPSSNWIAAWNASVSPTTNRVVTDPSGGDQALKLTNTNNYAGFAFRAVTLPTGFRLEVDVYAPSNNGSVGFQVIDLWTTAGGTPTQRLISFQNQNIYVLGDSPSTGGGATAAATFTGYFSFNTWHHVTIDYQRSTATATADYYVDSTYLGQWSTTSYGGAWDTNFHYLGLAEALTGSYTAYFDNVSLSAIPEPSTYAAIFGLSALSYAVYRRRKQPV